MSALPHPPNLSGEWIGHYVSHHDEVVRVEQIGTWAVATKITGDTHVPAEEITWRADVLTGEGQGQIAEEEYRNPRFVPGTLEIQSEERIRFTWTGYGAVDFRRDD